MIEEARYSRHMGLFGREGQDRIAATRVAIVGLGGLGAHVAQQLAYLGVHSFVLVDADTVSPSNLNRLVGARPSDAAEAVPKVDVASRVIKAAAPDAVVGTMPLPIESQDAQSALAAVDYVFGCVDLDLPRLKLTEICARLKKPYCDLASDTDLQDDAARYGGRVLIADSGERCLVCMKVLDQREMARAAMSPTDREEDDRIYGVTRSELAISGPSVVSINGVVASLAVTEFMAWATGLRRAFPFLIYRGDRGRVSASTDAPERNCYYCHSLWGGAPRA